MMINNNFGNGNLDRSDESDSLRHQFESSITMPCQLGPIAHRPNATFLEILNKPRQGNKDPDHTVSEKYMPNTKDKRSFETKFNTKERVKVQHLQTHSKLQNNRWNHHSFCGDSVDGEINMPNINGSCNQKDSAFQEHRLNDKEVPGFRKLGTSNLPCASNRILDPACDNSKEIDGDERTSYVCRTEDQENAFRRIEDVHNYSKLNRNTYTNDSSNSSLHEDDMEDDERDEDDVEVLDESLGTYGFFKCQQELRISKDSHKHNAYSDSTASGNNFETRGQLQLQRSYVAPEIPNRPDHHARRPMNAFLIFCKRHRAIVKDRYKSLENRAITKILGDWWASLDLNEKKCYTSLAQQNKDAFFNANPNFKWYKLPAPPLRTLHTRPNNTEHLVDCTFDIPPNDDRSTEEHVFKLADETQMGDLSALIGDRDIGAPTIIQASAMKTKEFMKIANADRLNCISPEFGINCKTGAPTPNISYNEEGLASKKISRQCKGKIYRELISSGQISAVPKKKILKVEYIDQFDERNGFIANGVTIQTSIYPSSNSRIQQIKTEQHVETRECINASADSAINFDLDEKISELPALSLDTYLQRKRNNQKKKKTTSKKRFPSLSRRNQFKSTTNVTSSPVTPLNRTDPSTQAVGSQKRKARKESITRRDVSAVENEVASLLSFQADFDAIPCNSNYFCNDSSLTWTTTSLASNRASDFGTTNFSLKPRADELSKLLNSVNNNNNSSTSDLLILAEAAAKRTEISN